MKRSAFLLLGALGALSSSLNAQEATKQVPAKAAAGGQAAPKAAARTPDGDPAASEKAIQSLLGAFTKAFNAGDAKAVAATYTSNAIVVDEDGVRTEGRAAIQDQYSASFDANPGSTIAIEVDSLHLLSPETALEQGYATITSAGKSGTPEVTRFTAIYVKRDGQWLQAAVRDERTHDLTPHHHLKDLEWLVGEWINESQDAVVDTTCKWTEDGNFLVRDFTMKTKGKPVLTGTQRIGWDPLRRQFKTWIFDSGGGHGEGYITADGDRWVIKVDGVGDQGLPITATNIVTRLGKDRMSWQSVDRTLGGFAIPGIDEFVVVRKPPEAGK